MSVTVRDPLKLSPDFGAMRREELQVYVAKCPSSDTVYDASTSGLLVFEMPLDTVRGTEILGIGYNVVTAFTGVPTWKIGLTTDIDAFCTLTNADLGQVGRSNVYAMARTFNASDFTAGSDMFQIIATIDDGGAGAGEVELSVHFRPSVGQLYNVGN